MGNNGFGGMKMGIRIEPKVVLLSTSYDPQRVVASAAKLCYSSSGIEDLVEKQSEDKTADFIKMLVDMGHESPIEHASFTFGIENVSRALLAQITRHRIASFSVQSQRYVRSNQFEYIIPPRIERNEKALEAFISHMEACQKAYDKIAEALKEEEKSRLLSSGVSESDADKKAEKAVLEDARFVLPNAASTKMIMTMNARSLMNFFAHRCCNRAQWEIRDLATKMLKLCRSVAPQIFENAGPSCLSGPCTEGKMSCGMATKVREKFKNL